MDRKQALKLVKERVSVQNLVKHMLAAEAIMRRLAQHFAQDEVKWSLAGLLHDIDYSETADSPERHGLVGAQLLEEMGVDPEIIHAVKAHADKAPRQSLMDKALYATDPLTGLIVASALIHPERKLASVTPEFVLNRFGEKSFARGADRDRIDSCREMGLERSEFIELGLQAMQGIADDLGL